VRRLKCVVVSGFIAVFMGASPAADADPPKQDPPIAPSRVFLNDVIVDDVRGVTLVDMRVVLRSDGSIRLYNPAYRVERRPGMAAQIVRKADLASAEPALIVGETTGGAPGFVVQVWVEGRLIKTFDGTVPRDTFDLTGVLLSAKNNISFKVLQAARRGRVDRDATISVTIGLGSRKGSVLAIDRVLATFRRSGRDTNNPVVDRVVDLTPKPGAGR
jgi:hypothetical protein